ncbi:MAG: PAS domain S-box protein [Deltaproteobacteria bacterium]|nr:PAS domain S-box protein [Deltaproteobacteria bacterium]
MDTADLNPGEYVRLIDELQRRLFQAEAEKEDLQRRLTSLEKLHQSQTAELSLTLEELREAKENLEVIFATAPLAMGVFNTEGKVLLANQASEGLLGRTRTHLGEGQLPWQDLPGTSAALTVFEKVLQGKTVLGAEVKVRERGGAVIDICLFAGPLRTREGHIRGFVCLAENITERKRSQEMLNTTALVLANMAEGVTVTDEHGYIVYTNPAFDQIFGYEPGELLGQHSSRLNYYPPEENIAFVREILQQVNATGVWRGEFHNVRKDGTPFFTQAQISNLKLEGKKLLISLQEDITERKQAEAALQESEARYRSLFQNNHAVMLLIDPDTGDIIDANPAACAYYGFSQEELTAKKISEINTLTQPQIQAAMQAVKLEERRHFFFQHRLAGGEVRDVEVFSGPTTVQDRELIYSIVHDITERKEMEDALRQERDFSAALLDTLGALVIVLDREGRIVRFNQACETLSGYSFEEVKGKPFFDIFLLPEERGGVEQTFNRLTQGDFPNRHENHWLSRSGEKYLINWSNTTLTDPNGDVTFVIGTGIDVTKQRRAEEALLLAHKELERRVMERTEQLRHTIDKLLQEIAERERAEALLRESEARFAAFMKHLPGSAIMRDRQGRFLFVNESWEKILGRKAGESLGKTVDDFWPPQIARQLRELDQEVLRKNRPLESVVELTVDGSVRTFLTYRFPIANEAGQLEMVGAIGIDITDRLKAEEARDRLIAILEATPDFVGSADREGRVFYLNRAARDMLGLDAQCDTTDLHFKDTQPPWAVDLIISQGQPIYAREGVWQGETAILRRDGSEIPVSQVILAHRTLDGRVRFFSTICRDISAMKQAEDRLKRSEEKLRSLTTQLITAQESERKRLAAELHDELGHALLTLKLHLSSIEKKLLPEQADLKERMRSMVSYLSDTVEEVRRLYHDLSPGDLEDLGLTTALRNMVEEFRELYPSIDVTIDMADIDGLMPLPIQTMIYRVVQEALTNIGKHANPEHVTFRVSTKEQQLVFLINDDGCGFSLDEVLHGETEQTGMGLATMAQRVTLVGGVFDCWSLENQGTHIIFTIPYTPPGEN